jgi:translation initiation factor 3 subunit A
MRIDHKNGTVHFGKLQLESDRLRDNISVLAQRLANALTIIDPLPSADKEEAKRKVLSPTSPQVTSRLVIAG